MKENLKMMIEHEKDNWDKIFRAELEKFDSKKFSSYWWQNYYEELTDFINDMMICNGYTRVIEVGSGSGKATILLKNNFQKTLLDISSYALNYAKKLAKLFNARNVTYINGDIFSMSIKDKSFDLVWNIGVIEHYDLDNIKEIIREMIRVCSKSGIVAVGIPNFYSGPIIKAWILKKIKLIPGYKLDTEKFYNHLDIENVFRIVADESKRNIEYVKTESFGNPLIMETPSFLLKTIGKLASFILKRNKFLKLIVCKFE